MKRNPEHESQVAVINWCRMARKDYPEAQRIFAIPNGGARHVAVAIKLKAEGVRQGVPDLCLPVPRGHYHGLYIEMKAKPNRLTDEQERELDSLRAAGYLAVVCWNSIEAIVEIASYLDAGKDGAK